MSTTLSLIARRRFELGLNNLYVFRKELGVNSVTVNSSTLPIVRDE